MFLDDFDRQIIAALLQDGRMPVTNIAEHAALSATPTSRRLKRLEDEGVILGYAPILDPKLLGLKLKAYVLVNLQEHTDQNISRFETTVHANPYITACHAVTGDMDYMLQIVARDVEHLTEITLKMLLRIPGVRDVRSMVALEEIKPLSPPPLT